MSTFDPYGRESYGHDSYGREPYPHDLHPHDPRPQDPRGHDPFYDEFGRRFGGVDPAPRRSQPVNALGRIRAAVRQGRVVPAALAAVAALLTGGGLAAATQGDSGGAQPPKKDLDGVIAVSTSDASVLATVEAPDGSATVPTTATPAVVTTAVPPPATPPPPAPQPTTTTTVARAPDPEPPEDPSDDPPGVVVETSPGVEPVLFLNSGYVGRWVGAQFNYSRDGDVGPAWLLDSTIRLTNRSGASHEATVTECAGVLRLWPPPPDADGPDEYWFSDGAPFAIAEASDDHGLEAMNAALAAAGLDPLRAGSYGVPLAADGSADRLVWYQGDGGYVWWVATYDTESDTFTTIDGDPHSDPGYEIGVPSRVWHDLDNDNDLESAWQAGESLVLVEWASGEQVWRAPTPTCS